MEPVEVIKRGRGRPPSPTHLPKFSPTCTYCAHWSETGRTCSAFPNGIPAELWKGGGQHHMVPFPGDKGTHFQLARDVTRPPAWATGTKETTK